MRPFNCCHGGSFGGDDADSLLGGSGAFQNLFGDGGNDTIRAGTGEDQFIDGVAGDDVILVGSAAVSDILALFNNW
ncbi:MAG: hypothetical protein FJX33_09440 [Alphaproteobacteria bacterium]|nr:hypothetical protein [Alphaproteobacteria bacterium]